jgi:polyferredoxin
MNSKIRAWLLVLITTLVIAAVTGVPDLKQPELVEPIALIAFFLIDKR